METPSLHQQKIFLDEKQAPTVQIYGAEIQIMKTYTLFRDFKINSALLA